MFGRDVGHAMPRPKAGRLTAIRLYDDALVSLRYVMFYPDLVLQAQVSAHLCHGKQGLGVYGVRCLSRTRG